MSTSVSVDSLNSSTTSTTTTTSTSNTTIDFEDFISLLVTELQNQDPTDPVETSEYMSQLIGIESLEQLNNTYTLNATSQAISLIGKEVAYQTTDSSGNTTSATGTVDSVVAVSGSVYLIVDGTQVDLSSVYQVADASDSTTTA
ncbi:hypothetical protein P22_2356 [Propionispora sp. 2/2-37]|uniref:flagellar hook capping FlgD N-terminal domain-containing protein n=1 Tax=Propionispora sp. 2/2-37 TaxID=1677858 RepID=UPI0006BB91F2|nr:flagellar hook capping FlgD N-terminal domain-containing protein [Propionispora sp. 2/2-37]CUH96266.1 hypothetical protein P22_2356 [Propionispora sp. 2/2-37]